MNAPIAIQKSIREMYKQIEEKRKEMRCTTSYAIGLRNVLEGEIKELEKRILEARSALEDASGK